MSERGHVERDVVQLSIIIPVVDRGDNVRELVSSLLASLPAGVTRYEVIVADGRSPQDVETMPELPHTRVVTPPVHGYGSALRAGFDEARGEYVLTLDSDLSHPPDLLPTLWQAREQAEVVIASRYTPGGSADMGWLRYVLSRLLNAVFSRGLSLPVRDLSSGFRLYKAAVVHGMGLVSTRFDVLQEILIRAQAKGWCIYEVPLHYCARSSGHIRAKLWHFGWAYLRTFVRMWQLRNSIDSADYDYRAFASPIPLQRYWQRKRHQIVTHFARGGGRILDIGCGSSRILSDLEDAVGVDIQISKVRYAHRYAPQVAVASAFALPFPKASFDCVISSQVIEHLPADPVLFSEMARVLKADGRLIIGTPDYGPGSLWLPIEWLYARLAPGGYADEHITHYTHQSLKETLGQFGFKPIEVRYVGGAEMILLCSRVS